jgi:small subunit ribosomal protein S9
MAIMKPFVVAGVVGQFNATVKVEGGGITGQAGAISHGIARALVETNESLNCRNR